MRTPCAPIVLKHIIKQKQQIDKLVYFEKDDTYDVVGKENQKIYFDKLFKYFNIRIQNIIS
jgi:hypothetical protein